MPAVPRAVAGVQAAYLLATGIWPLVHRDSFERVAGKKREFWLVRTVGGLAAAQGIAIGLAALRGSKRRETTALALASGVVWGAADLRAAQTESPVYLGDAFLQVAFAAAWLAPWERTSSEPVSNA